MKSHWSMGTCSIFLQSREKSSTLALAIRWRILARSYFKVEICSVNVLFDDWRRKGETQMIPFSIDVDERNIKGEERTRWISFIWFIVSWSIDWSQNWLTSTTVERCYVQYWYFRSANFCSSKVNNVSKSDIHWKKKKNEWKKLCLCAAWRNGWWCSSNKCRWWWKRFSSPEKYNRRRSTRSNATDRSNICKIKLRLIILQKWFQWDSREMRQTSI